MPMEPWYRVVTLRKEVREGRSFSPDEFAIALEQVVAGTAPSDYSDPAQFFSRTCFTRALTEHSGMVLRRLSGTRLDVRHVQQVAYQLAHPFGLRVDYPVELERLGEATPALGIGLTT